MIQAVQWSRWSDSLSGSLHHDRRAWLGSDAVAGVTVWAVLAPGAVRAVLEAIRSGLRPGGDDPAPDP